MPASVLQASVKVLAVSISSTFVSHSQTLIPPLPSPGSRKLGFSGGYNVPLDANPFTSWATVLDCGDIPVTSYDNAYAISQIEQGHHSLLARPPATNAHLPGPSKAGLTLPRIITLGGDHTITLPLLRSVTRAYGPVSVVHFDSHLDTWKPKVFGGAPTEQASINHGTYFYHAHEEGLLSNDSNIHAGIRTTLSGTSDYDNDGYCGFEIVEAREIDIIGMGGIIKKIRERVGTVKPVYLSIDIDTLDPACKPFSSTPILLLPPSFILSTYNHTETHLSNVYTHIYLIRKRNKATNSLINHSRTRNRHTRNRRLDDARTPDGLARAGGNQFRGGRHCGSCAGIRHQCRTYHYGGGGYIV